MKELFEQNKVLFLAVITALIIVFLVKKPIQLFVSESMLKEAVQLWFDSIKDLLDDGKLNNSVYDLEDVEEVSREDKINHTTELDDGTWTNYAETPLPETDLEDPEEQEQTEDNQAAAEQEV